jgi:hypothetical protein
LPASSIVESTARAWEFAYSDDTAIAITATLTKHRNAKAYLARVIPFKERKTTATSKSFEVNIAEDCSTLIPRSISHGSSTKDHSMTKQVEIVAHLSTPADRYRAFLPLDTIEGRPDFDNRRPLVFGFIWIGCT